MDARRLLLALAAMAGLVAPPLASAQATIVLAPGAATTVELQPGTLTSSYVIDTTAADRTLVLTASANADVDLLLRFGTPFQLSGSPISVDYLLEQAHYRSFSSSASERIVVSPFAAQPVRAGRWYVVLLNLSNQPTTTTLTATPSSGDPPSAPIDVVFDDPSGDCGVSAWSDGTARQAVGGNPGTTLGQLRRNAMLEAIRLVQNELRVTAPLRVQACFRNLGTGNSVTLASAGPRFVLRNTPDFTTAGGRQVPNWIDRNPWLPRTHTWFPVTTTTRLAGSSSCGLIGPACAQTGGYDLTINFNDQIDTDAALGPRSFWYGFTAQPAPAADVDFVTVAMHELLHGLGFVGYISRGGQTPVGAKLQGFDDIYSSRVAWVPEGTTEVRPFPSLTNEERATAMTSISQLRWNDEAASASEGNPFAALPAPDNLVRLWAPSTIETGSTLSHIANAGLGFGLMESRNINGLRTIGLARPMLEAVGWSNAPRPAPTRSRPRHWQYVENRPGASLNFGYVGTRPDGIDIYYAILFSYGADGQPEWYLTAGPIIDGVFMPANNANGDSFPRPRVNFAAGTAPPDPAVRGQIRIDFNEPALHPACAGRERPQAVMAWSIGADNDIKWCLTELIPGLIPPPNDLTGLWGTVGNLPDGRPDFGWGLDVISFRAGTNDGLFAVLYYPDANGEGRWAFMTTTNYVPGTEYPLFDRTSACRTCPIPPNEPTTQIGTIRLDLREPLQGQASVDRGNRIRFRVTYPRAPGGVFERDAAVGLQSTPVPASP